MAEKKYKIFNLIIIVCGLVLLTIANFTTFNLLIPVVLYSFVTIIFSEFELYTAFNYTPMKNYFKLMYFIY